MDLEVLPYYKIPERVFYYERELLLSFTSRPIFLPFPSALVVDMTARITTRLRILVGGV